MYETAEERQKLRGIAAMSKPFGESDATLATFLKRYQKAADKLKLDLIEKIRTLPDNPRIKRIGNEAFTIQFKDIAGGQPLSPFYHDFKAQYNQIIKWIETETPDEMMVKIGLIIEKGFVARGGSAALYFHPDVRKFLKELE